MRWKRQWKNTVMRTWLISYCLILLVPILFNLIIYQRTISLIREEINVANGALLSEIRRGMDNILRNVEGLGTDIMVNNNVKELAKQPAPLSDSSYYQAFKLQQAFGLQSISRDSIADFYVYFKESDCIVSPDVTTDSRRFYTLRHESNSMDYTAWLTILSQDFRGQYIPVPLKVRKGDVQETVAYINTIAQGTEEEATVVILIDTSALEQQLRTIEGLSQGDFYIIDYLDRTIYSSSDEKLKFAFSYKAFTEKQGITHTEIEKQSVVLEYDTSEYANWKYIYVTPEKIFLEKVRYIKQFIVIDLALCLALGGVMIYVLAKKNYMPLKLLLQKFKTEYGYEQENGENEFSFIEKTTALTWKEHKQFADQLKAQNNVIRQSFLTQLLQGTADTSVLPVEECLREYQISFVSDSFAVMIFYIEDVEELFPEEKDLTPAQRYQLMQFIMTNIAEEVMAEEGSGVVSEAEHVMAGIISLRTPQQEALRKVAEKIQGSILEYFQMEMTVAVSEIHTGADQIHICFEEAVQALQYKMLLGNQELIFYKDIQMTRSGQYYYPLEAEQTLTTQIKAGNFEQVEQALDNIYQQNFSDSRLSVDMAKCLLFDLVGTVTKTIPQTGEMGYISGAAEIAAKIGGESAQGVFQQLKALLQELCRDIREKQLPREEDLKEKAIQYIEQHYTDDDLGVASIAQIFGLTPSYVSRLFREAAGISLPDYILNMRMEKAKQLIEEDTMQRQTFQEIAEQVGFANVRTFRRQFKKYTDVTPGEYREMMVQRKS